MLLLEKLKKPSFSKKSLLLLIPFSLFLLVLGLLLLLGIKQGLIVSPYLQIKALRTGYWLVYQQDHQDKVGRSVLAWSKRTDADGFNDFWGGDKVWWKTGKLFGLYGVGFFEGWEKTGSSGDKYMIVTGPRGKGRLKVRIILEEIDFPSTKLVVENLDVKEDMSEAKSVHGSYSETGFHVFLGTIELFGFDKLEEILKKGDTVALVGSFTWVKNKEGEKVNFLFDENNQPVALTDEAGVPVLSHLGIRRFGGVEQIGKELGIGVDTTEKK